jgi:hypothetical protein
VALFYLQQVIAAKFESNMRARDDRLTLPPKFESQKSSASISSRINKTSARQTRQHISIWYFFNREEPCHIHLKLRSKPTGVMQKTATALSPRKGKAAPARTLCATA